MNRPAHANPQLTLPAARSRLPGGRMTAALAVVAALYAGWVILIGSGDEAGAVRYPISALAYAVVVGGTVVLARRASRLMALPSRVRQAWHLLGAAWLVSWAGYLLFAGLDEPFDPTLAATVSNAAFLGFYVLVALALPRFAAAPRTAADRLTLTLDTAMVVIPAGMVLWWFMLEPLGRTAEQSPWALGLSLAFPLCDLAVLTGLAATLVQRPARIATRSLWLLTLGMLCYVFADVLFARQVLEGVYRSGALPNAFWMAAIWLFGASAQQQLAEAAAAAPAPATAPPQDVPAPAATPVDGEPDRRRPFSVLPYVGAASGYGLLLAEALTHDMPRWSALVAAAGTLTGCLIVRQIVALRENERLLAERAWRQGEARFSSLVRHSRDVVAIAWSDGTLSFVSPSVERVLGHPPASLEGTSALALVDPADAPAARALLADAIASPGAAVVTELRMVHANGSRRACELIATSLLDDPAVRGVVLTCRDVTERHAFERELTELALHDRLTGLPNRTLLLDRAGQAMARARRRQGWTGQLERGHAALLFVDLDNFKVVNESLGLPAGDQLLVQVARRLRGCLRDTDTLARMGGDELVVLIEDAAGEAAAVAVAERLLDALAPPFCLDGHDVFVSASVGIALDGPAVDHPTSLLRNAALAMDQAKARGKGRWALFDPDLNAAALARLEIETGLRRALENGELRLVYQPIVDLADGTAQHVEALVRWHHPVHGEIPPARFIPVAEESGLIGQIGGWVLREACREAARWQAEHPDAGPLVVGVNLSGHQLRDPALTEAVARALDEAGLDGACLELELTETVVMEYAEETLETLHRLKALGARLVIDDFGTGYSSLSYLKRFPVDGLKIDRSFVDGVGRDPRDTAIIESIIAVARGLGLVVTGEGVETAEQAAGLERLGCDRAQGYYFARPRPLAELTPLLTGAAPLPASGKIVPFLERSALPLARRQARP